MITSDEFFAQQGIEGVITDVKELEDYIARGSRNSDLLRDFVENRKDWLRRNGAAW